VRQRATIGLVLRVLAEQAEAGFLVGQVEVVDTGEIVDLHTSDELLALVRRLAVSERPDELTEPGRR
jgi:hypothetical protein